MTDALEILLRLNVAIGTAIVVVLLVRDVMCRAFGARVAYAFWSIVPLSGIAVMIPGPVAQIASAAGNGIAGGTHVDVGTFARLPVEAAASSIAPAAPTLVLFVWALGAVMTAYLLSRRQRAFVTSLGQLLPEPGAVRTLRAELCGTGPVIIGAILPRVVLPGDFEMRFERRERDLMLAHEQVHLRRGDPQVSGLIALAQCICWFNPLVHLAAGSIRIDQELACDAVVVARAPGSRRVYAEAMLKAQLSGAPLPVGCGWTTREARPLRLRIAMLRNEVPRPLRIRMGMLVAASISLVGAFAVWAAQPARPVHVDATGAPLQGTLDAQLLRAARGASFREAEAAIAAGADVNVRTEGGATALAILARSESVAPMKLLLDHGADPNADSIPRGNALMEAVTRGHRRAAELLLDHGADVDSIVPGSDTALHAAVRTDHAAIVVLLVEHGADVNLASPLPAPWDRWDVRQTPLEIATLAGHDEIAGYLVSHGARM